MEVGAMKTIPFYICFLFTFAVPMDVSGEESPKVHTVVIKAGSFEFLPDTLTIQTGERVQWVNQDPKEIHFLIDDFLSYSGTQPEIGSHILESNQTFEYTFLHSGRFPYQCFFHYQKHQMKGVIIVEGKDLEPPPF